MVDLFSASLCGLLQGLWMLQKESLLQLGHLLVSRRDFFPALNVVSFFSTVACYSLTAHLFVKVLCQALLPCGQDVRDFFHFGERACVYYFDEVHGVGSSNQGWGVGGLNFRLPLLGI